MKKWRLKDRPVAHAKAKHPFTTLEKMELAIRWKLQGEDPTTVVPPVYQRHGLTPPRHPSQPLTSFLRFFENRLAAGDDEAVGLARQHGVALEELREQPKPR